jgi:SAM-dependent methyltransferase
VSGFREIEKLVRQLPEVYQPIFGFSEFSAERQFHLERINQCVAIANKLSEQYKRPLKILDLGCAQGYLSFSLASHNHQVVGIEYLKENFELCEALARNQSSLDVQFFHSDLMKIEQKLDLSEFDLVVAYSILHHPIHRDGLIEVKQLMARVSQKIPNAIVESAISDEPVFWASSLPKDPRMVLSDYFFIRQIGEATTHLSDVQRPIHFCSNTFVLINDNLEFIRKSSKSEIQSGSIDLNNIKRHFFTDNQVVKIVGRFAELDDLGEEVFVRFKDDLSNELVNLVNLPASITKSVKIIETSQLTDEVILSRTHITGETVESLLSTLSMEQRFDILSQTLEQLLQLEQLNLVHNDLRTWNILWDSNSEKISIVDLGAVTTIRRDEMWPFNPYYSIVFFALTLCGNAPENKGLLTPRSFPTQVDEYPLRIQNFVKLALETSMLDLNIEYLHRLWSQDSFKITTSAEVQTAGIQLLVDHSLQIAELSIANNDLRKYVHGLLDERKKIDEYLQIQQDEIQDGLQVVRAERDQHLARIEAVRNSTFWRITKPLRGVLYFVRRFYSKFQ